MSDDCGQDGVCAESPGCLRHWAERVREVMAERDAAKATFIDAALIHAKLIQERDEARDELKKTQDDFQSVWESRDTVIKERERARQACDAYWHDLMRIALLCAQTDDEYPLKAVERTVRDFAKSLRERDEALAQVARREREHEALVETAQKALATIQRERDEARAEVQRLRGDLRRCREVQAATAEGWRHEVAEVAAIVGAPAHTAELAACVRAEIERLRVKIVAAGKYCAHYEGGDDAPWCLDCEHGLPNLKKVVEALALRGNK